MIVNSNLAEVDGFFWRGRDVEVLSTSSPEELLGFMSRVWDFILVKNPQE